MKIRSLRFLLIFSLLFISLSSYSYADETFMSIAELEVLLEGNEHVPAVFDSVPKGTKLARYTAEIKGVLRMPGLQIILFTTSYTIESGMSGSPVYVDGKLIGALAYKLSGSGPVSWGGISPIHLMQREANSDTTGVRLNAVDQFDYRGMNFERIPLALISTTSEGSTTQQLELEDDFELKAGMPIVVDLASWIDENGREESLSSMGTITYVSDEGRVYAFGHPFLDSKKVRYSFRTSEVLGTISNSNKLGGKVSRILGTIDTDSSYGIYGNASLEGLEDMHDFILEFENEGVLFKEFHVRVANSIMTPSIASAAFRSIGSSNGAPLDQEASVTEIDVTIDVANHRQLNWSTLYYYRSVSLGINTFYLSSYTVAINTMLAEIYRPLFVSNYDFDIDNVRVVTNFVSGQAPVLKLSSYDFPEMIVWGESPVLRVQLVAEDNSLALDGNIEIDIDWSKVQKPLYSRSVKNSDKEAQKRVWGSIYTYGSSSYHSVINMIGESNRLNPNYYFGAKDYLDRFSERLGITTQAIYGRIVLKAKEVLFDEEDQPDEKVLEDVSRSASNEWVVFENGLEIREEMPNRSGNVVFNVDFPKTPSGYIVFPGLRINNNFEIVLDEEAK